MDLQLAGKIALVTGSGRGIGADTALALAKEGCKIVVSDVDPPDESDDEPEESVTVTSGHGAGRPTVISCQPSEYHHDNKPSSDTVIDGPDPSFGPTDQVVHS